MHYAKALIRPLSHPSLRSLEARAASPSRLTVPVTLVDTTGEEDLTSLLHPARFAEHLETFSKTSDAISSVKRACAAFSSAAAEETDRRRSSDARKETPAKQQPVGSLGSLYVKGSVGAAKEELERRQVRLLAKWEGRLMARDFDLVAAFVKALLDKAAASVPYSDSDIAAYRGAVEELSVRDAEAALAIALDARLPPLNAGASGALAKMVDINATSAIAAFLEAFAARDAGMPGSETCATQLACRLRHALAQSGHRGSPVMDPSRADRGDGGGEGGGDLPGKAESLSQRTTATLLSMLQRCVVEGNVDPGAVFPTDAAAIQRWASACLGRHHRPPRLAAELRRVVQSRFLLPRRVAMNALSVWCLSDLERGWVRFAAFTDPAAPLQALHPAVSRVFRRQSLALVLKDPKRYLVQNRFLHEYATLLEQGEVSPEDPSFSAFLEECGECHDPPAATQSGEGDRPTVVRWTMRAPAPGVTIQEALRDLAPVSSYWRTLLAQSQTDNGIVSVKLAPMGNLSVEVNLPSGHECVSAAQEAAGGVRNVPVLYEDSHIVVFDKPAGLATSRHALSGTQTGLTVTDLVSLFMTRPAVAPGDAKATPPPSPPPGRVFRQGQVHRLDEETSGCVVFAKTDEAMDSLRHQMGTGGAFAHNSKVYLALCVALETQLSRLPLRGRLVDPEDVKVHTDYRILRFFRRSRVALVECRIQQGAKHQIRRHLAAAGLPILGDLEHGGAACCSALVSRVALHARCLSFVHPVTAEACSIAAPLPEEFQRALSELGDA